MTGAQQSLAPPGAGPALALLLDLEANERAGVVWRALWLDNELFPRANKNGEAVTAECGKEKAGAGERASLAGDLCTQTPPNGLTS